MVEQRYVLFQQVRIPSKVCSEYLLFLVALSPKSCEKQLMSMDDLLMLEADQYFTRFSVLNVYIVMHLTMNVKAELT